VADLNLAAKNGHAGVIKLLLDEFSFLSCALSLFRWKGPVLPDKREYIESTDCNGKTAIEHGKLETVRGLMKDGTSATAATNNGLTPLHRECGNDDVEVARMIMAECDSCSQ